MKNVKNNVTGILEDMRKITMLTGEISSVHQNSLTKWPYIIFDDVQNVEIKYDLSQDTWRGFGQNWIQFHITASKNETLDLEKRCEMLDSWVKDMLWNEIETTVYINESLVYPSPKQEESINGFE
jgi:hypothetical protein